MTHEQAVEEVILESEADDGITEYDVTVTRPPVRQTLDLGRVDLRCPHERTLLEPEGVGSVVLAGHDSGGGGRRHWTRVDTRWKPWRDGDWVAEFDELIRPELVHRGVVLR